MNAIVPDTNADSNRPEGAIVTDRDSITSTYSSLDVCRTPGRRQGIAGPWFALAVANDCLRGLVDPMVGVDALDCSQIHEYRIILVILDSDVPGNADASEELPHPARYLDNLLQCIQLGIAYHPRIAHLMQ